MDTSHPPRNIASDAAKYYYFGLKLGFQNLIHNRLELGIKKTAGKILQPINSYTRLPEYCFMGNHVEAEVRSSHAPLRILDVASPKCFGLYVAYHFPVEIHLTDIDHASMNEAGTLWKSIRAKAKARAVFSVQDARALDYSACHFDIVYAMSVIEHVAGEMGDSLALRELERVLRPGGLLLLSLPMSSAYVEQQRVGFEGAARTTADKKLYFFQRIYDPDAVKQRVLPSLSAGRLREVSTVCRKETSIAWLYSKVGENPRALLGWLNPWLSVAINEAKPGLLSCPGQYGPVHSTTDSYGDVLLAWERA